MHTTHKHAYTVHTVSVSQAHTNTKVSSEPQEL